MCLSDEALDAEGLREVRAPLKLREHEVSEDRQLPQGERPVREDRVQCIRQEQIDSKGEWQDGSQERIVEEGENLEVLDCFCDYGRYQFIIVDVC